MARLSARWLRLLLIAAGLALALFPVAARNAGVVPNPLHPAVALAAAPAQGDAAQELSVVVPFASAALTPDGVTLSAVAKQVAPGAIVQGIDAKVAIDDVSTPVLSIRVTAPNGGSSDLALQAQPASQAQAGRSAAPDSATQQAFAESAVGNTTLSGAAAEGTWSVQLKASDTAQVGQHAHVSLRIRYQARVSLPELRGDAGGARPAYQRLPAAPDQLPAARIQPDQNKPAARPTADDGSPQGTQTLLSENFEGAFPTAGWQLFDLTDDGNERVWDDDDYKPFGGAWSAWPARGGAQGLDPQVYYYPNTMNSWMIYGPVDLSNATDAQTVFRLWREIEVQYDHIFFGTAGDGINFSGYFWDGIADWEQITVGMSDRIGDSSVWVGWQFSSDSSVVDDGPFVDDIVVTKQTQDACGPYTSAASQSIPDDGNWLDIPITDQNAPALGSVADVLARYNLDHPDPTQVEVRLTKDGSATSALLWNRGVPLAGNRLGVASELSGFHGVVAGGAWHLRLRDVVPGQQGSVSGVSVRAYYATQGAAPQVLRGSPGRPAALQLNAAVGSAGAVTDEVPAPNAWEVINNENFDGTFPNSGWQRETNNAAGCDFKWDNDDHRPRNGIRGAWPAAGGANALDPSASRYPPSTVSKLIYGPFSLSNASDADTLFSLWRQLETGYDSIFFGVSADGNTFNGLQWDGTAGWEDIQVNYSSYVGDSSVWVAWVFSSDSTVNYEGPWIDDVQIRKFTGTSQVPDVTIDPTSFSVTLPPGQTTTRQLTIGNIGTAMLNANLSVATTSQAGAPLTFPAEKVAPGLSAQLQSTAGGESNLLVYMREQADLSQAYQIADWTARGRYVYDALWSTAQRSQSDIKRLLNSRSVTGSVSSYQSFYIANAVLVRGDSALMRELAARPDVAYIDELRNLRLPETVRAADNGVQAIEWGISKIRANQVWSEFNNRGAGVVVASIDTGVQRNHPALTAQYRGTATGSNDYNWFDPSGTYPSAPGDNNGHGTHTTGTMVGFDGGSNQIGVAPQAQWIAAKGCGTASCSGSDLLASAQWVLAPFPIGGSPANGDPSKRPNIVNNSWGSNNGGDLWYQASVNAWRAAGIFPAFSAGNNGTAGPGSVGAPGSYAASFASGATDISDVIAGFSSRGPSPVTSEVKPDVSAPGVNVRSSINNGGYGAFNGTSMASPHVAGCAALMLSRAPNTSVDVLEQTLTRTASDKGASGPDFNYGHGRIDCYSAVAALGSNVSWLTLNPAAVAVQPNTTAGVTLSFNASDLTAGTYTANITISSNDPDENSLQVPVTLIVQGGPTLSIPANIPANTGQLVDVPVSLATNGLNIASTIFSIDYDQACLSFNPADGNGDGIPDAVRFSLPGSFSKSATFSAADTGGELDFFIADTAPPLASLPNGTLATISLQVTCQAGQSDPRVVAVNFSSNPPVSFGNTSGQSIPGGTGMNGSVAIQPGRRGDCNGDQSLNAGDISALILEIFDGDGSNPNDTPSGSFRGNPVGCNPNSDSVVDAADVTAAILLIFGANGGSAGVAAPDQLGGPAIALPQNAPALPNSTVVLPITYTSNGNGVNSLLFSINYDQTLLSFDPTDADGDGVPDAIGLSLPPSFSANVTFDATDTDSEIDFAIISLSPPPLPTLTDGVIATLTLRTANETRPVVAPVDFASVSFGSVTGQSLAGTSSNGSVRIDQTLPTPTNTATATPTPTSVLPSPTKATEQPTKVPEQPTQAASPTKAPEQPTVQPTATRTPVRTVDLFQLYLPITTR